MAGFANWRIEIQRTFIHVPGAREEQFAQRVGARASSCPPLRLPIGPVADRKLASHEFCSAKSAKSGRSSCLSTRAPSSEIQERGVEESQAFHVDHSPEVDAEEVFHPTHRDAELERQRWVEQSFAWEQLVAWELAPAPPCGDGVAPWQLGPEAWDWSTSSCEALGEALGVAPPPGPYGGGGLAVPPGVRQVQLDAAQSWAPSTLSSRAPPYVPSTVAASLLGGSGPVHTRSPDHGWISCPAAEDRSSFARHFSFEGPEVTSYHRLHNETSSMGELSRDGREFVKTKFEGRLSVVTESQIRTGGVHRYLMQFTDGDISSADGVGFIFSGRLPCPKNIQQITSVFVNRGGRICMRSGKNVVRANPTVRRWEVGDHIEVHVDLEGMMATFRVWPRNGRAPSVAKFDFGAGFAQLGAVSTNVERRTGYLAAVVQNLGVGIALRS